MYKDDLIVLSGDYEDIRVTKTKSSTW